MILRYRGLDSQVQGPGFLVTVAWILRYKSLDTQEQGPVCSDTGAVYSGTRAWILRYRSLDSKVQGPEYSGKMAW